MENSNVILFILGMISFLSFSFAIYKGVSIEYCQHKLNKKNRKLEEEAK